MKQAIIYLCVLCALCGQIKAANEIRAFSPGISTAYSVVREIDGDIWCVSGQVFEAFGTGARTMADYNIALTDKSGGMFVGDMDTNISAGDYHVVSHYQVGGAPDNDDPAIWMDFGDWDGATWTPSTVTAGDVWEELVADHTGETTFGGEVGGLDPNITLIKYKTDLITIHDDTVKTANDANNFIINTGKDANDAFNYHVIMVTDADDSNSELRWISSWYDDGGTDPNVTVDRPFSFTPASGDVVHIMGTSYGGWLLDIYYNLGSSESVYDFRTPTLGAGGGTTTFNAEDDDP